MMSRWVCPVCGVVDKKVNRRNPVFINKKDGRTVAMHFHRPIMYVMTPEEGMPIKLDIEKIAFPIPDEEKK